MTRFCKQGHEQTPENQKRVVDKVRGVRYRCKPCSLASQVLKGTPSILEQLAERRQHRVEDIEFLLDSGASYSEVVSRSGYSSASKVRSALKGMDRLDLLKRFNKRRIVTHVRRKRETDSKTYFS